MIIDNSLIFSDAQAITASAASTNVLDFLAMGQVYHAAAALSRDVAKATCIPLLIQVVEAFDSAADDGTLTVDLELDSTTTFTPDKTIRLATAVPQALLVPGKQLLVYPELPAGISLQYARLKYTVGGSGNFTAGKVTAAIVAAVQTSGVDY